MTQMPRAGTDYHDDLYQFLKWNTHHNQSRLLPNTGMAEPNLFQQFLSKKQREV
jgi:hypothetical protein